MDGLDIEVVAQQMINEEGAALDCVLTALDAAGCELTQVTRYIGTLEPPQLPYVEVFDTRGLVAKIHWMPAPGDRPRLCLGVQLRQDLRETFKAACAASQLAIELQQAAPPPSSQQH
jgi:hypothetical protein